MLGILSVVSAASLAMASVSAPDDDPVRQEYRRVEAQAGRTPLDHVRLALWCESRGLDAERARHLALAVLADPANAVARGLSGLVSRDGRWVAPEVVASTIRRDADRSSLLAEYDARRSKAAYKADEQLALATWAEEKGLHEQARAHFVAVTRIDPSRESAWKKLGYKKVGKGWATDEQVAASKAEADAQKAADRTWKPLLEGWKDQLGRPDSREAARTALLGVTDPRAVPSIVRAFVTRDLDDQQEAVRLLGQVAGPEASRVLAGLAVRSKSAEVRRGAVETLRRRDPRDFVHLWVAMVRSPIKFEVQPVKGPGQPGALFIENPSGNLQRIYRPLDLPAYVTDPALIAPDAVLSSISNGLGGDSSRIGSTDMISGTGLKDKLAGEQATWSANIEVLRSKLLASNGYTLPDSLVRSYGTPPAETPVFDREGRQSEIDPRKTYREETRSQVNIPIGRIVQEANASAVVAEKQLERDAATLAQANRNIRQENEIPLMALSDITGQSFGDDPKAWTRWWTDQRGYALSEASEGSKPTFVEYVPLEYTPSPLTQPTLTSRVVAYRESHSCFAAGTEVRTADGSRPIESIRRGDLVLTQDTRTGALGYRAVLTAFHNPPSPTFRVRLASGEAVEATGIHRFWLAGDGWKMARDLVPGDTLRVLGGAAKVEGVDPIETPRPVFNLEVDGGNSFFVGKLGALVHDNSQVEATPEPFDAPPRSETAAPGTPRR